MKHIAIINLSGIYISTSLMLMHCAGVGMLTIKVRKAISCMFTVKFTFSEPFAILLVTSSHLHILILLVLVIMGAYILSLHLLLDVHNSLVIVYSCNWYNCNWYSCNWYICNWYICNWYSCS